MLPAKQESLVGLGQKELIGVHTLVHKAVQDVHQQTTEEAPPSWMPTIQSPSFALPCSLLGVASFGRSANVSCWPHERGPVDALESPFCGIGASAVEGPSMRAIRLDTPSVQVESIGFLIQVVVLLLLLEVEPSAWWSS